MHAVRWPITRRDSDPAADDFFRTLGHLVGEELRHESSRGLPTSDDPVVAAAIDYTQRTPGDRHDRRERAPRSACPSGPSAGASRRSSTCRGARI